jgi:hypothetical protein
MNGGSTEIEHLILLALRYHKAKFGVDESARNTEVMGST